MEPTPAPSRLYFLDWLRIGAFGVLIAYHVGMYYVSWDWHVKSPFAGPALEPLMRLSSPWRLSLLFLVSGAATSLMLRGGTAGFVGARSKRLLLPLLFGMFVVVPPQAYFEVVHKLGYADSYLAFMQLYVTGHGGFCRGGDCLLLPTWNHLWFVAYLWVYTVALWAVLRLAPGALDRAAAGVRRGLAGPWMLVLPILVLAALRLALADRFPSTHALVDDWFNHAVYVAMFGAGAVLARTPAAWAALAQRRWPALAIALAAWALLVTYAGAFGADRVSAPALRAGMRGVVSAMQWCAVVAAIGFAWRHLNADHRWRRALTEAVFPVYILHQTLIVMFAMALRPLHWAPIVEGPVLVALTFGGSLAGWALVRRAAVLRPLFGLAAGPPRPAAGRGASLILSVPRSREAADERREGDPSSA